jgi:hypothetical protein
LSPRSAAYALSVLGALFRWLIEQRYAAGAAGIRDYALQRIKGYDQDS